MDVNYKANSPTSLAGREAYTNVTTWGPGFFSQEKTHRKVALRVVP
jgi:hypothetical protein